MVVIVFGEFNPDFIFAASGLILGFILGCVSPFWIFDKFGDKIFDTHNKEVRRRQELWDNFRRSHNYNYSETAGKFEAPIEIIEKLNRLIKIDDKDQALELLQSKTFTQLMKQCEDDLKGIHRSMCYLNNGFHTLFFDIERSYDLERTDSPLMKNAYPLSMPEEVKE